MRPPDFERRAKDLVGRRIVQVRYHEIDYCGAEGQSLVEPHWDWCPDLDSLDYGLDLTMEDGAVFHVTWGSEFSQYGVTVQTNPLHDVSAARVWDGTTGSRWAPLIGCRIAAADVFWETTQYRTLRDDGSYSDWSDPVAYPQDLRLTFEGGAQVYLSAFEIREGGFRAAMTDHISVFFEDTAAKEYRIGPFASGHGPA